MKSQGYGSQTEHNQNPSTSEKRHTKARRGGVSLLSALGSTGRLFSVSSRPASATLWDGGEREEGRRGGKERGRGRENEQKKLKLAKCPRSAVPGRWAAHPLHMLGRTQLSSASQACLDPHKTLPSLRPEV